MHVTRKNELLVKLVVTLKIQVLSNLRVGISNRNKENIIDWALGAVNNLLEMLSSEPRGKYSQVR